MRLMEWGFIIKQIDMRKETAGDRILHSGSVGHGVEEERGGYDQMYCIDV